MDLQTRVDGATDVLSQVVVYSSFRAKVLCNMYNGTSGSLFRFIFVLCTYGCHLRPKQRPTETLL